MKLRKPPVPGAISDIARAAVGDGFGSKVRGDTQVICILIAQNTWKRNSSA